MAEPSTSQQQRPIVGILWMLLTGAIIVGVTAGVKHAGGRVPAAEAAFLRFALGLVFFIPVLPALMRTKITRRDLGLFSLRGFIHTFGVISWFFAMTRLPLAEVTAMNYLTPIYISIGAALFLGERFAFRRLFAVVIGLLGALVILRPGIREVDLGHIAMLVTTLTFAASYMIAKAMSGRNDPLVMVAMFSITVTIGLAPIAALNWVTPTMAEVGWFTLVAFLATAAHYTMTLAFRAAPISVTQPVTFLQLVWASLLGWFAFDESVDIFVVLGGVMILGAVSFITWRESVLKRRETLVARDHP